MNNKPIVLMILDGFGLSDKKEGNGVKEARTPTLDRLTKEYPFVKGYASGLAVGLPEGQMGNSEVGHLNIGAGRIVYQELTRITKSIEDGEFFENRTLLEAMDNCKRYKSDLHLFGLLSNGGVHSSNQHLYALLKLAKKEHVDRVFVHVFLDGRDTAPTSGLEFIKELEEEMGKTGVGKIATVMGRYFAMDRDNRWDRVETAYKALTKSEGLMSPSAEYAVQKSYNDGVTDEFVQPIIIAEDNKPLAVVKENDSVIFFNFRPDRARQITRAFCDDKFASFDRGERVKTTYVCFTEYDVTILNTMIAFGKTELKNTFGEFLAAHHMKQLRLAETEKYAHVTFFFNGGVETPNEGEERILINSPKVATYDLQPEMSAFQVCDTLVKALDSKKYDVIIINFANPDMVGHTGNEEAVIKAIEAIDECVKRSVDALIKAGGIMFLCADHGNAEQMINYATKEKFTAHTTNPVPFLLVNANPAYTLKEGGRLCDIVPTLIELMGLTKPKEMTGDSLLIKKS